MQKKLWLTILVLNCVTAIGCSQASKAKPSGTQGSNTLGTTTQTQKSSPQSTSDGMSWTKFIDPNEQAFSVDVPTGWKTQGGLVRRGPVDLSMFLRALSSDDSMMLILGDPGPAYFGTPGFGAGPKAVAYTPGEQYARKYAEQFLPSVCSEMTFVSGGEREDVANGILAQGTPYAKHDAGEVTYSCIHNGKPTSAYIVAGTFLYASPMRNMPGSWGVNLLAGCLAPADRLDAARKIVLHMLQSAREMPQWVKIEQGYVDAATRNINAITAAQQSAFETNLNNAKATQAAMRGEYNAFSEVQTQTGTFGDTQGRTYTNVQNTQAYHWVNSQGQITETNSATPPPGSGWTRVNQVAPPQ